MIVIKEGRNDCTHASEIRWEIIDGQEHEIGRCRKCSRVVDYTATKLRPSSKEASRRGGLKNKGKKRIKVLCLI